VMKMYSAYPLIHGIDINASILYICCCRFCCFCYCHVV